jgi:ribosomal protein S18 acetylase RimI-like enzyme
MILEYTISEMTLDRYGELMAFWRNTEGIWNSDDDDYPNLDRFLRRNPGMSLMALCEGGVIGAVKCGHDGRRGYLHHLAVKKEFRDYGLGRELVERCLQNLHKEGIRKIRVFVLDNNETAIGFWKHLGFNIQYYDYRTLELNG